jgi:hypothetical protein
VPKFRKLKGLYNGSKFSTEIALTFFSNFHLGKFWEYLVLSLLGAKYSQYIYLKP